MKNNLDLVIYKICNYRKLLSQNIIFYGKNLNI